MLYLTTTLSFIVWVQQQLMTRALSLVTTMNYGHWGQRNNDLISIFDFWKIHKQFLINVLGCLLNRCISPPSPEIPQQVMSDPTTSKSLNSTSDGAICTRHHDFYLGLLCDPKERVFAPSISLYLHRCFMIKFCWSDDHSDLRTSWQKVSVVFWCVLRVLWKSSARHT